jgi:hypothetical protein
MPIFILVLTLVAYGYLLIVRPDLRRPALAVGALVTAGLAAYFLMQPAPEASRSASRIAVSEITLDEIAVERTARGASVSGRVSNGSKRYRLRDMTLALRLRDCADARAAAETCPVIGEGAAIARPDVPAGQIRAFSAHFSLAGVPPAAGTLRWELTVTETRATDY